MILDTTYLFPLARIKIDVDILRAIAENKVNLKLEDIAINAISIFELQAKATKLNVPANFVIEAVKVILKAFKVEQFHRPEIIKIASEMRNLIPDYVDCIIIATAIFLRNDLLTEDSLILSRKGLIERKYGIKVLNFSKLTE